MMFNLGKKLLMLIFKNFARMKIILSLFTTFLFRVKKKIRKKGFQKTVMMIKLALI